MDDGQYQDAAKRHVRGAEVQRCRGAEVQRCRGAGADMVVLLRC